MSKQYTILIVLSLALLAACSMPPPTPPAGTRTVAELLADPVYDTEVRVYGRVSLLGELFCPCFELESGEKTVQVWYNLMVEDDGTEWPAARIEGIANGDWVVVTGKLKPGGTHHSLNDFWASAIEPAR